MCWSFTVLSTGITAGGAVSFLTPNTFSALPEFPAATNAAVKPDVVLYEEALDQAVLQKAAGALRQADLLIVGGTSLTVYPAAGLLRYFQGSRLAVVNQTALSLDQEADLLIQGQIGQVFSQL